MVTDIKVHNHNPINYLDYITDNFYFGEFWCKCSACKGKKPTEEQTNNIVQVAINLQALRIILNDPRYPYLTANKYVDIGIRVISGLRCPANNKASGGAANSKHLTGEAVDPKPTTKIVDLFDFTGLAIKHTNFNGFGYGLFKCHFDIGNERYWRY